MEPPTINEQLDGIVVNVLIGSRDYKDADTVQLLFQFMQA